MSKIQDISFDKMNGERETLANFHDKVVLIVNVASKCGLTPQYEALQSLYKKYAEKGFEILAFPANNFGAQEPGANSEIESFCKSTYGISFPLFKKISVNGHDRHSLYAELIAAQPKARSEMPGEFEAQLEKHGIKRGRADDILWNFEKFLVNKKGKVIARYSPEVTPSSKLITEDIEAALKNS